MLALSAALIGPYFVDWTSYRAEFEREASRVLGRQVTVAGEASARLLPFPSVTFTDVRVAGVEEGETAMTVERFSMDAELAPFMRGEFLIFDMRLERPTAVVDIAADGTVDWSVRPSVPVNAGNISLEKLTVTEGKVEFRHAASGRTHQLTEINADVSARALTGPWRIDGSARLDGMLTALAISTGSADDKGGMRLRVRALPERYPFALETDGHASLGADGLDYAGTFRLDAAAARDAGAGENAPPAYRLSGAFDLGHALLDVPEFRFETGSVEDPYVADGAAEFDLGSAPRFSITADGAQVRIPDAAPDETGGLSMAHRIEGVRAFLLDMPKPAIPGSIEVNLPAVVAGDTTVRDVRLTTQPSEAGWTVSALSASLPGRTTLEASGELAVGDELAFSGDLLLAVGQPSGFAAWLSRDVDEAIRRLPSAGFAAKVELGEEMQSFSDLELILGDARFRGAIERRTPRESRPSMSLELDGDRLDVEGMAAFASLFVSEEGRARLGDHDLDFEIAAGPVTALGLTAETIDTALRLREGALEIDRLSIGGLAGANVSATGQIRDFDAVPRGNLDATVIAPDLAPLITTLATRFPDNEIVDALARRASRYPGLFADAEIDLVASAASDDGSAGPAALTATGTAGGTRMTLTASLPEGAGDLAAVPVRLDASASAASADALYALAGLPSLPIGFVGPAEMTLLLDGTLADGAPLTVAVKGEGLDAGFDGDLTIGATGAAVAGHARLEADDIEPWLLTGGLGLPGMGYGLPVNLEADVALAGGAASLSALSGSVGDAALGGDFRMTLRDGVPHLEGALDAGSLDLAMLAAMTMGDAALTGGGEGWPAAPFQQSAEMPATAALDVEVGELAAGTLPPVRDARFALRLEPDGFAISDFEGETFGGRITGLAELRNNDGTGLLNTQWRLEDAGLVELLPASGLDGRAALSAALTSSGKSIEGLVASLAGSGTAQIDGLSIPGVNPAGLQRLLSAADAFGPQIDAAQIADFAPGIVRDGTLRIAGAEIAFTVANGTLRAPPLLLDGGQASLGVQIAADLMAATASVDATLTYEAGREALVGSEPAVRFVAEGPLQAIATQVDTQPLAQFLTQRALEAEQRRVEAMQAALLEKQRYRREVRYYASLQQDRERMAEEARRASEEAERLERIRQMQEDEARRAVEAEREAERIQAEEAARAAEEEARAAEEAARAAERDAERDRLGDAVEDLLRTRPPQVDAAPPADPDAIERAPLAPPAEEGASAPAPAPAQEQAPAQAAAPSNLPGVRDVFTEENLSIDSLLRGIGQ